MNNEAPRVPPTSGLSPTACDHVLIPRSRFLPCLMLQQDLQQFNPLSSSNYFDDRLYLSIVAHVGTHIQVCTICTVLE